MKQHFIVAFDIGRSITYCLWYTNDMDGFVLSEGHLLQFDSVNDVRAYGRRKGISLQADTTAYSIAKIEAFLEDSSAEPDCNVLLDFWNIVQDMANAISTPFLGEDEETDRIYSKLFHGSNLPSVNASGKLYIPRWHPDELDTLRRILCDGITIIKEAL